MMILGIDIAKDTIDVTLIDNEGNKDHATFKNNKKGFGKLLGWLKKHQVEIDDLQLNYVSLKGFSRHTCFQEFN